MTCYTHAGPGSGSGSIVRKQASRQPLLPLEDRMKATANMHSSQPLPEKPAWGEEAPGQASKAAVGKGSRSTSSQGGQRSEEAKAAPAEQGKQITSSPVADERSTPNTGIATTPVSEQSREDEDRQKEDQSVRHTPEEGAAEAEQSAEPSPPGKQLSLHLTPTLEADVQQSPQGSAQPNADHNAERCADGRSHGTAAEHDQPVSGSVKAAQSEEAVLPNGSDRGMCEAAEQALTEEVAILQDHQHEAPGHAAAISPGPALSLCLVAGDLPETEVQLCPTQLLTPCPAGKGSLTEAQTPSPSLAPPFSPAAPAGVPLNLNDDSKMHALQHTQPCKQLACETQLEPGASARTDPGDLYSMAIQQAVLQPQGCSACPSARQEETEEGAAVPNCIGLKAHTPAAASVEDKCRDRQLARDAVTAATATQRARQQRPAHHCQALRASISVARSPAPSEQVSVRLRIHLVVISAILQQASASVSASIPSVATCTADM